MLYVLSASQGQGSQELIVTENLDWLRKVYLEQIGHASLKISRNGVEVTADKHALVLDVSRSTIDDLIWARQNQSEQVVHAG